MARRGREVLIELAALTISLAAFAWSIGWTVWQHRRTTRPHLLVGASHATVPLGRSMQVFEIRAVNKGAVMRSTI